MWLSLIIQRRRFFGGVFFVIVFFSQRLGALDLEDKLPFSFRTEHYCVTSDIDESTCRDIANNLEDFFQYIQKTLPFQVPERTSFQIRAFSIKKKYDDYIKSKSSKDDAKTSFVYYHNRIPERREVIIFQLPSKVFYRRLRHEAFHQYFRSVIQEPPQWINEGIAEYLESGDIISREFHPQPSEGHVRFWRERIQGLDPEIRKSKYERITLEALMKFSKEEWAANSDVAYCQSWGLVYFLLHSQNTKYQDFIKAYVRSLAPDQSRENNSEKALAAAVEKVSMVALEFDLLAAIEVFPEYASAMLSLGKTYVQLKRYDRAMYFLNHAMKLSPSLRGDSEQWLAKIEP